MQNDLPLRRVIVNVKYNLLKYAIYVYVYVWYDRQQPKINTYTSEYSNTSNKYKK